MKALKGGHSIGIMIDQKYNEGIQVPFFGRDAATNSVHVQLAQKFNVPLIFAGVERIHGAHFKITFYEEVGLYNKNKEVRDIYDVMQDVNILLENHIVNEPAQWLWNHRRWASKPIT